MFRIRSIPFTYDPAYNLKQPPAVVVVAAHSIWKVISKTYDPAAPIEAPLEAADDLRYKAVSALCTVYRADNNRSLLSLLTEEHNQRVSGKLAFVNDSPESTDLPVSVSMSEGKPMPSFTPAESIADIMDHLDMQEIMTLLSLCLRIIPADWLSACYEECESSGIFSIVPKKKDA